MRLCCPSYGPQARNGITFSTIPFVCGCVSARAFPTGLPSTSSFFFAVSFVMKWSCVLRRQRRNVPHGTGLVWKCAWFRRCRGPHATLDSSRNVSACPRMTTMCSCYEHFPAFSSSLGARPKITNFKPSVFVSIFLHEQRLQLFTVSWTDKGS